MLIDYSVCIVRLLPFDHIRLDSLRDLLLWCCFSHLFLILFMMASNEYLFMLIMYIPLEAQMSIRNGACLVQVAQRFEEVTSKVVILESSIFFFICTKMEKKKKKGKEWKDLIWKHSLFTCVLIWLVASELIVFCFFKCVAESAWAWVLHVAKKEENKKSSTVQPMG